MRHGPASNQSLASPTSGTLVVANLREQTLTFLDFSRPAHKAEVLHLPGPPHEVAEAHGRFYVTLGRADLLVEVDPGGPAILRTLALEGNPHGIAVQGTDLLVTLDDSATVVRIDRATLTTLSRHAGPAMPHAIAADGASLYVAGSGANNLVRLTAQVSGSVLVGAVPESVAVGHGLVATADSASATVTFVDLDSLEVTGTVAVGARPSRIIALPSGRFAVALNAGHEVAVLDAAVRTVVRRLPVGPSPDGLCASAETGWLAATSAATGRVSFFEIPSFSRVGAVEMAAGAGACLWLSADR